MLNKQSYIKLAKFCEDLGNDTESPMYPTLGLCHNLYAEHRLDSDICHMNSLDRLVDYTNYPNYSGLEDFPITPPRGVETIASEYYCNTIDKWTGDYGVLRREFCLWCSGEFYKLAEKL